MSELLEAQKDSILGLVNEIFIKGEFVCPVDKPVLKNEVAIDVATDYEKAVYLAQHAVKGLHNQGVDKFLKTDDTSRAHQILFYKRQYKALSEMFWLSVKNRLGKTAIESDGIALRKNWQIVSLLVEEKASVGDFIIFSPFDLPFPHLP